MGFDPFLDPDPAFLPLLSLAVAAAAASAAAAISLWQFAVVFGTASGFALTNLREIRFEK